MSAYTTNPAANVPEDRVPTLPTPQVVDTPLSINQIFTNEPAMPLTWSDILIPLANPECLACAVEGRDSKVSLLKDLLSDEAVAKTIRQALPWALADDFNLYDLLHNRSPHWAKFVALLFEYAERQLGRFSRVFPISNLPAVQADAVATVLEKVDVIEILVCDPSMSPEDCRAIWRANAENFIREDQLIKWGGQNSSFWAERGLTKEMVERLFQKVMTETNSPSNAEQMAIRKELLEAAKDFEKCVFGKLTNFDLLAQRSPRQTKITLADQPSAQWSASQFLKELSIQNPVLAENLKLLEEEPESFKGMSGDKVSEFILGFGATHMQAIKVINALRKQKFIQ